jgi:hypothetical protein
MRIQIEMLEHHTDIAPDLVDIGLLVAQPDAVHDQFPVRNRFQPVDATDERAFAGAGRPDYDDDLAGMDGQINVFEHMEMPVMLVDLMKPYHTIPPSNLNDKAYTDCNRHVTESDRKRHNFVKKRLIFFSINLRHGK